MRLRARNSKFYWEKVVQSVMYVQLFVLNRHHSSSSGKFEKCQISIRWTKWFFSWDEINREPLRMGKNITTCENYTNMISALGQKFQHNFIYTPISASLPKIICRLIYRNLYIFKLMSSARRSFEHDKKSVTPPIVLSRASPCSKIYWRSFDVQFLKT